VALDIEQLVNLDLGFPGIPFADQQRALESELSVLGEQILHAQPEYRLRLESGLEIWRRCRKWDYRAFAAVGVCSIKPPDT